MIRRLGVAALLLGLALLLGWGWQSWHAREGETIGLEASKTLTARFEGMNALKVGTVSGDVLANSHTTAMFGMVPVVQNLRAPYSVDYFVDLSKLSPANYRWNAKARVMSIDVPDVTIAAPNVDASKAAVDQKGLYVSRSAGIVLQQQAAARARAAARATAERPVHLDQARANARSVIARFAAQPLAAAGLSDVKVAVRFPSDPRPAAVSERVWDESTPLSEILAR